MLPQHSRASSTSSVPPPSSSQVRLRLACDACTQAKLRCSKTQPCERCTDNDQPCFYSASRRHGKRKRPKNTSGGADNTSNPSMVADPCGLLPSTSSGMENLAPRPDMPFDNIFYGQTLGNSHWNSGALNFNDWSLQGLDMSFDPLDTSFGLQTSSSMTAATQAPSNGFIPPTPFPSAEHLAAMSDLSDPSSLSLGPNESKDIEQVHDCEALGLEILQSLHLTSSVSQTGNKCNILRDRGGGKTSLAQSSSSLSVDTVLSANKAALTNLIPLLKCDCVHNCHNALLYSSILSKVMFWYRIAISARFHTEGLEVRPLKVQLGKLEFDDDDQAMLQRTVLLRELRRGEKVVESYGAYVAENKEAPGWLVQALKQMLEALRSIIRMIQKAQEELG